MVKFSGDTISWWSCQNAQNIWARGRSSYLGMFKQMSKEQLNLSVKVRSVGVTFVLTGSLSPLGIEDLVWTDNQEKIQKSVSFRRSRAPRGWPQLTETCRNCQSLTASEHICLSLVLGWLGRFIFFSAPQFLNLESGHNAVLTIPKCPEC